MRYQSSENLKLPEQFAPPLDLEEIAFEADEQQENKR